MDFDIDVYDGLHPCAVIGYVKEIIPKISAEKELPYGKVLFSIPKRDKNNKKEFTTVPFYLGFNLWKKYKSHLSAGDLYVVYFKLTGNETNGIHYCNASITSLMKFNANGASNKQTPKRQNNWAGRAADSLDHYEHEF
jgi:hypothetical protein